MKSCKSMFVIGAGASVFSGMPTGYQLKSHIFNTNILSKVAKNLTSDPNDYRSLFDQLKAMSNLFLRSDAPTIDAFLESRTDYAELGKLLISSILLPKERAYITHPDQGWDWIGWLFNQFPRERWTELPWPVGFVTFNYDRIIEYAFRDMIAIRNKLSLDEAAKIVLKAPIVHIYGAFSHTNDTDHSTKHSYAMTPNELWPSGINQSHIRSSANSIYVMNEERASDNDNEVVNNIKAADEMLTGASKVIFLGFGYDKLNLSRIGIDSKYRWTKANFYPTCFCTTYGLEGNERNAPIKIAIPNDLDRQHHNTPYEDRDAANRIGNRSEDCLLFLRSKLTDLINE